MESILRFNNLLSSTDSTPSSCSPTEDLIFEDSFANEIYTKFIDDSGDHIDLFSELDRNHEKMVIDDDFNFGSEKSDLPNTINDFVAPIAFIDEDINDDKNERLLMEFNSILNAVSNTELTPPQTPPNPEIFQEVLSSDFQHAQLNIPDGHYEIYEYQQQIALPQQHVEEQYIYVQDTVSPSISYEESNQGSIVEETITFDPDSIISSPSDIQRELEVVDELVRAHSRNNSDFDDNASQFSSLSSVWSPRSEYSSGSSCSSQYGDFEPKSSKKSSSGLKGVTKKRTRGYGRNPDEKKSRKKEQNKNAATRYRQKKKVEIEVILDEEKILENKHRKLLSTYKDTRREVKYLKSLLHDLFKARGFIQ